MRDRSQRKDTHEGDLAIGDGEIRTSKPRAGRYSSLRHSCSPAESGPTVRGQRVQNHGQTFPEANLEGCGVFHPKANDGKPSGERRDKSLMANGLVTNGERTYVWK